MRFHERAPFVPIEDRPPLTWPNGARLAVWVVPNIPNYAWRDYGPRVGIWRTMRMRQHQDVWFATGSEILDAVAGRVEHAEVVRG
jgi:allantoinase